MKTFIPKSQYNKINKTGWSAVTKASNKRYKKKYGGACKQAFLAIKAAKKK